LPAKDPARQVHRRLAGVLAQTPSRYFGPSARAAVEDDRSIIAEIEISRIKLVERHKLRTLDETRRMLFRRADIDQANVCLLDNG